MPVLATKYMECVLEEINDNQFKINNEWFEPIEFCDFFIQGLCVTVYKYHGVDINEPYNIYDVNKMNKKQLYTAFL